ncbi:MAG: NAD-dependent deacylase [Thermovirgaceae bacterium]|nr:NAD-dependent deacylase [Thermovirgaceae bacterium]
MSLETIAECIARGQTVVLTGAGMSTASGLPDFRGKNGLWKSRDPRLLASVSAMENDRGEFAEFYRHRIRMLEGVEPNAGHRSLADWEERGLLKGIITQNVDGLHQAAGSKNVQELHGNLRVVRCSSCRSSYDSKLFLERSECPECGGRLRPGVVLFGENLPERPMEESDTLSETASCFLVLGSSLEVSPANGYPIIAKRSGAKLFIINMTPTHLDALADVVIHGDIVEALGEIDKIVTRYS